MSYASEQLDHQVGRLVHENGSLKRQLANTHDRLRKLENKVRKVIVVGEPIDADGLYALRQMVPNKPRPKYKRR